MHKRTKACAITQAVKKKVYERDRGLCIFCGRPGDPVAHVVPRSKGGLGVEQNIVTACGSCHAAMDNGVFRSAFVAAAENYLAGIYGEFDRDAVTYRRTT